jgi:hypothetical protein
LANETNKKTVSKLFKNNTENSAREYFVNSTKRKAVSIRLGKKQHRNDSQGRPAGKQHTEKYT